MSISGHDRVSPISIQDYLDSEATSRRKHEYVDGQIYAMVGGRYNHNLVASNVLIEIGSQLRQTPCRALNSDSKVRVQNNFYYPDVSVVCGDNIRDDVYQEKPTLVVEVLSQGTRRIDEGEKLQAYQKIETLATYILLEQDFAAATVYHRTREGFTRKVYAGMDAVIPLAEIGTQLSLQAAYANVTFQPEPEPE
ncbi:MAG: Uma2 family endonuclease [Fuerstiella sp.]